MSQMHPIEMFFSKHHPLTAKVNVRFDGSKGNTVRVQIEASSDLVADTVRQTVHSGFATIVLDSIMGGAVMGAMEKLQPIATIGLSVNHLRKAKAGEIVYGKAVCQSIYNSQAYVTGELFDQENEPLAIASGTFMIGTRATSIRNVKSESRI